MTYAQTLHHFLSTTSPYDPRQFALWRVLFGLYLAYYFARMLPFAASVFSGSGMLPDASLIPTYHLFPGIFALFDSPQFVYGAHVALIISSLCITVGFYRRSAALFTWYGWASLAHRNYLIVDPSYAFIGWLLLALAIIPTGEPYSVFRRDGWYMPHSVYMGALAILGLAYSASGIERLSAVSWRDGSAIRHMFDLAIVRHDLLYDSLIRLPTWVFTFQTYAAVCMFILALPLLLYTRTRPYAWVVLTLMFVYMGVVLDLTQVILGLLLFHAFVFDARWISLFRHRIAKG